ncbi:MAG: DinB family protein [Candidatus Eisenbacteria bacterium]
MPTQTMTEKDQYLATFDREYEITMRLLRAYPTDKADLKPSPRSKSAREIAWMLAVTQQVIPMLLGNELPGMDPPPPPASWDAVLAALQAAHSDTMTKLRAMRPEDMNGTVRLPTGPKQMSDVRRGDAMWMFLYDTIHHRGQFSVYQRIAGGKMPSVYGPTADEPWW